MPQCNNAPTQTHDADAAAPFAPRRRDPAPPAAVLVAGRTQRVKTLPDRYRTSMCRHMARRGRCPAGARCHFAHSEAELRTVAQNRAEGLASRPVRHHLASPKSGAGACAPAKAPPADIRDVLPEVSPTDVPEADVVSGADADSDTRGIVTVDLPAAAARFTHDAAAAVPAYQHLPYAAQPLAPGDRASRLGNVSPSLGHSSTTYSHSHASAAATDPSPHAAASGPP